VLGQGGVLKGNRSWVWALGQRDKNWLIQVKYELYYTDNFAEYNPPMQEEGSLMRSTSLSITLSLSSG